jgi:hypothetical protein
MKTSSLELEKRALSFGRKAQDSSIHRDVRIACLVRGRLSGSEDFEAYRSHEVRVDLPGCGVQE